MRKACAIIFAPITAEVLHSAAVCRGCRQPFKWRLLVRLLKSPKTFRSHKNHTDHHDGIQDRFNGRCHRDEVVDEPEKNTNHNQNHQDVN